MIKAGQTILLPTPGHEIAHQWVVVISAQPETVEVLNEVDPIGWTGGADF